MKILKPGLDYRLTFVEFVNKTSFAKHIDNLRLVDEEDIEAERKDFMNKTASLSKDEMGRLLRSMGIAMKEFDLKALIDAFDADGGEDDDDDDYDDYHYYYVYDGENNEELTLFPNDQL